MPISNPSSASVADRVENVSGDTTLGASSDVVNVDASGAARTITLPAVASVPAGKRFEIKKIDSSANTVTIDGSGAETIEDQATYVLYNQYQTVYIVSNGSEWFIAAAEMESFNTNRVRTVTGNTTLSIDDETVLVDTVAGNVTITLPAVANVPRGKRYNIKRVTGGANTLTIDGSGAETIDDAATQAIVAQYETASIVSDGSEWWTV